MDTGLIICLIFGFSQLFLDLKTKVNKNVGNN